MQHDLIVESRQNNDSLKIKIINIQTIHSENDSTYGLINLNKHLNQMLSNY